MEPPTERAFFASAPQARRPAQEQDQKREEEGEVGEEQGEDGLRPAEARCYSGHGEPGKKAAARARCGEEDEAEGEALLSPRGRRGPPRPRRPSRLPDRPSGFVRRRRQAAARRPV